MNNKDSSIDMLHGGLFWKLIIFAFPIALSSMFQQLFNAADTAVVGKFADADALAAVGTNGEIVALLVSFSLGMAVGANVLLAKYIGLNRRDDIQKVTGTALIMALVIGIAGAVAGQFIARPVLVMIHTPESVLELAVVYLRVYFLGYPALLIYDFGSAILRSKGDSRRPFIILIISGVINVVLNLIFVIVFNMGVAGVATATDISTLCSTVLVLAILFNEDEIFRLDIRNIHVDLKILAELLKIGIPAALQGAVFCFANIFVQAAVNSFGADATAGSAIAMNFEYFGYYMITAFGQAATTFTSQNYAAGNYRRCRKILGLCIADSILFSGIIIVPLVVFRYWFSGLFTTDSEVVYQAVIRIMLILVYEPMCGLYEVPAGYMRGKGSSAIPAMITIIGTCMLRIVWIETAFNHAHTLQSLFIVFPISWVVTTVLMWIAMIIQKVLSCRE